MRACLIIILLASASACGGVNKTGECGDGELVDGEQCDEGALNGDPSSCCSESCQTVSAATVCRAALGECDVEETCDGATGTCPADVTVDDDTPCSGNGETTCSAADSCRAGVCDSNDAPAAAPCGDQPTCDPDACDGAGACVDNTFVADGLMCADGGGNTCCFGGCVPSTTQGMCDPCVGPLTGALDITIVESQSLSAAQNMDVMWLARAESLGHVATIQPQTVLDDIANLDGIDILIHSSHDIPVPAARRATILAFVESGRGAYVQGEFQAVFEGNQVFEEVIDGIGAGFTWGAELPGGLTVEAQGCFGTTPFAVPTMTQNFGVSGTAVGAGFGVTQEGTDTAGTTLPVGFRYCRPGGGLVVTTTDKDNIRNQSAGVPEFMDNVIYRLSYPNVCPL